MHLRVTLITLGVGSVTPQKIHILGLENCWKGQRTVSVKVDLFRAQGLTQRFNALEVSASTHERSCQNLWSCCFSLLFQMQAEPLPTGRDNMQCAARGQVSPNRSSEAFGRREHMVSVVFSTLRTGSYRGSVAGELPHPPHPQFPTSQGHLEKNNAHFPEFQDISPPTHQHVCACACSEPHRAHEQPALFVSQHPSTQQHHATKAPCSSPVAPGRSHQAPMPQPLRYEWGEGYH